jgi:membrane-bound lytic murein transglycosylase
MDRIALWVVACLVIVAAGCKVNALYYMSLVSITACIALQLQDDSIPEIKTEDTGPAAPTPSATAAIPVSSKQATVSDEDQSANQTLAEHQTGTNQPSQYAKITRFARQIEHTQHDYEQRKRLYESSFKDLEKKRQLF